MKTYIKNPLFEFDKSEIDYLKESNAQKQSSLSPHATSYESAVYYNEKSRRADDYYSNPFLADCDRIVNNALYNRYSDKTQVFSFYRNDDITRRGAHVQIVSRIARTIGSALRLNVDLIEAMALGHDLGHTPFGHQGEFMLRDLYHSHCGKYFNHNVHSFRILHTLTNTEQRHGLTIQTLDGILCHNGEKVLDKYAPRQFDPARLLKEVELTYSDPDVVKTLRPSSLEGCVVRISDMIAYIGKDRQDLAKLGKGYLYLKLADNSVLGKSNPDIMPKLIKNLIKNSIGKDYIGLSPEVYQALDNLKADNYNIIYDMDSETKGKYLAVSDMMAKLYDLFLSHLADGNQKYSIFSHHINSKLINAKISDHNDIVVDYIASMTDDYFIDIYRFYFGDDALCKTVKYIPYEHNLIL